MSCRPLTSGPLFKPVPGSGPVFLLLGMQRGPRCGCGDTVTRCSGGGSRCGAVLVSLLSGRTSCRGQVLFHVLCHPVPGPFRGHFGNPSFSFLPLLSPVGCLGRLCLLPLCPTKGVRACHVTVGGSQTCVLPVVRAVRSVGYKRRLPKPSGSACRALDLSRA